MAKQNRISIHEILYHGDPVMKIPITIPVQMILHRYYLPSVLFLIIFWLFNNNNLIGCEVSCNSEQILYNVMESEIVNPAGFRYI